MKPKEQLTILSITQEKIPEWDRLLEETCNNGRYDVNNSYDVISVKYRLYENIDHATWKLLSRMNSDTFSYTGKVLQTVVLVYPLPVPSAVINRIRLQCIVSNKNSERITWNIVANTDSGLVSTLPELEKEWDFFPSSNDDRKKFLEQIVLKPMR